MFVRIATATRRTARRRALWLSLLLLPGCLCAQEFGRNKVSYHVLDFSVLTTDHFLIYHYPAGAPPVEDAAHLLERWYARHAATFGFGLKEKQRVILYASTDDFQQTNAIPGLISAGEGGVTESYGDRIIMPLTGVPRDDAHVLGHELVHAFQFQAMKVAGFGLSASPAAPTWFIEGMAEYLSLGPDDDLTAMWMRDALLNKDVPGIEEASRRPDLYFPYRFGTALWDFIDRHWGRPTLERFFTETVRHGLDSARASVLHTAKPADFDVQWKQDAQQRYGGKLGGRDLPSAVGRTLTAFGGRTNLGPSISPDGRFIALFSQVDPFRFSLTLVDAATGRQVRNLGQTGTDTRFDALHFINASGGWSKDSQRFAFPVERNGHSAIAIAQVPSGRILQVIAVPPVADVSGVAWSPDGRLLAIAGTQEAVGGLWTVNLATGDLRRLTNGPGAYLQPAWSPDGTTLAFVTDAGPSTNRAALVYGSMNLGLMDVASGRIRILSVRDGSVHVDPQYSPDGRSLYFVASPDGVPDIYRYRLDTARFYRVTRVATGISGLTPLSPCLSVAQGTGDVAFTVFYRRDYELHLLAPGEAEGTEVSYSGAIALPVATAPPAVEAIPAGSLSVYHPTFELLSTSAASVGASVNSFGASLGGSAELTLQDVVGDHLIDLTTQINGTVDTLGGQLFYLNSRRRVAWGIGAAHVPQLVYSPFAGTLPGGADTGIVQQIRYTELAQLQAVYPLSANRRFEGTLSYSHIWWGSTAPVYYFSNGQETGQDVLNLSGPAPLDLVHTGIAAVGDYSFEGFTGPLRGWRYRFEIGGDAGTLFFLTEAADVRAYLFLRPFGFALRALEVGRWFGGADSDSLDRYYVGDPTLVRGYEYYSMVSNEGAGNADAPAINRLFGSRVAVANAEIRLPVLGTRDLGLLPFPWLPVTLVGFFDAGVAWTGTQAPALTWSTDPQARIPVFSAGASLRISLLGAAVLEIYFAWPFQRPGLNGVWGFLVGEGW